MVKTHSHRTRVSSLEFMGRILKGFAMMSLTYLSITAAATETLPLALLSKAAARGPNQTRQRSGRKFQRRPLNRFKPVKPRRPGRMHRQTE